MKKTAETTEFISKAINKHGLRYDYSKVHYENSRTKIIIGCFEHGDFHQKPSSHVSDGRGCPRCASIKRSESLMSLVSGRRPVLSDVDTPKGAKVVPVGSLGDYALVDEEDYNRVIRFNWFMRKGYAYNISAGWMHRFILDAPKNMVVDHIKHNTLDNRKSQLRVCTVAQNTRNMKTARRGSSKYKGVSWAKHANKWMAQIMFCNKNLFLGYFDKEIDAAKAYDEASKIHHGKFSRLNQETYPELTD